MLIVSKRIGCYDENMPEEALLSAESCIDSKRHVCVRLALIGIAFHTSGAYRPGLCGGSAYARRETYNRCDLRSKK